MLSDDKILENKQRYIELVSTINREGIEDLLSYLESSDFFIAPASTRYHGAYKGGLCEHCLYVYDNIIKTADLCKLESSIESLTIVSLFHDLDKINSYEETFQNKKVYSNSGSKFDEGGKYDWVPVKGYKTREDKFIYSNHEITSEFITRQFIQLSIEESAAICHHHGSVGFGALDVDIVSKVYSQYPLTIALHTADLISAYRYA